MRLVQVIGILGILFGFVNALAWRFDAFGFISDHRPYAGAVVFFVMGSALVALARRHLRAARALAVFAAIFAVVRLLEFRLHENFGATTLLHALGMPDPISTVSFAGSVCFFLYGIATALMTMGGERRERPILIALIGSVTFVLSMFALSGHYVFIPEIPGIGSLNTAYLPRDVGYLVLSFAMLAMARCELRRVKEYAPLWISIPIATSGLLVSLLTWQALRATIGPQHSYSVTLVLWGGCAMVIGIALLAAAIQAYRQKNRALEESYRLLHAVIDSSSDGVYVKDRAGRLLMINNTAARIVTRTPEEMVGLTAAEFMPESAVQEAMRVDTAVWETGRAITYEHETHFNGITRSYLTTKAPYRSAGGEIIGVVGVSRDITERKVGEARLRESEEKFRRIFDEASIGMILTDHETRRVARANRAFQNLLGYSQEEIEILGMQAVTHPDDREASIRQVLEVRSGRLPYGHIEKRYVRRDGEVVWADVSFISIRNRREEPAYLLAMVLDVTARRQAEANLKGFNETLEQRVAERTAAAEQSREALQRLAGDLTRSNEELQHFAYIASHDLQEPLRMISSYLTLLERRTTGKLEAEAVDFLHYAVDGAKRMKLLIDDLLKFSRVGSRTAEMDTVDCEDALDIVLANLQFAIADANGRVIADPLPRVKADSVQLTQLFQNLIGNALKFRRGPAAQVHIGVRRDGAHWEFTVRDEGIGFEPQYAERIFDIFQRLHSREEYPGTGVGLAICKKIVDRHGGRITAEGRPGEGAVFRFTLPAADEAHDLPPRSPTRANASPGENESVRLPPTPPPADTTPPERTLR